MATKKTKDQIETEAKKAATEAAAEKARIQQELAMAKKAAADAEAARVRVLKDAKDAQDRLQREAIQKANQAAADATAQAKKATMRATEAEKVALQKKLTEAEEARAKLEKAKSVPATSNSTLGTVVAIAAIIIVGLVGVLIWQASKSSPDVTTPAITKADMDKAIADATATAEEKAAKAKMEAGLADQRAKIEELKESLKTATAPVLPPPSKEDRELKIFAGAVNSPHGESKGYLPETKIEFATGPAASRLVERETEQVRQDGETARKKLDLKVAEKAVERQKAENDASLTAALAKQAELEAQKAELEEKVKKGEALLKSSSARSFVARTAVSRNTDSVARSELSEFRKELKEVNENIRQVVELIKRLANRKPLIDCNGRVIGYYYSN